MRSSDSPARQSDRRAPRIVRTRGAVLGGVVVAAALVLSACGGSSKSAGASAGSASAGSGSADVSGKKVTLISCTDSNPWCNAFNKGVEKTLGAQGVKVTTQTSNFDAAESSRQFAQAVSQKPDLILYYVNDPNAAVADYRSAKKAKIPVVVVDTVVGEESKGLIAAALQPDHAALGKYAAQNIQEGLEKEGIKSGNVIAITGTATQLTTQVRMKAFKAQLASTPQYKLVEVQDGNWDAVQSATIASQMFAKYGKNGIQAIYGMADYQAASIAQAAQQAGVPLYPASSTGVVITGSNCSTTGIEAMKAGHVYGDATQAPAQEAEQYAPYIVKVLKGQSLDSSGPISVPVDRFTATDVAKYASLCTY